MKIKSVEGRAKFGKYETWYRVTGDIPQKNRPSSFSMAARRRP